MAGNGTFLLVVNLAHLHSEKSFVWYDVIGGPNLLFCHILDLHSVPKCRADIRKCSACSAFDANTPDSFKSSSKSL